MTPKTFTKEIRVLYLDDEDNNLKSFKAAFRRDYEVYTANNTEDAFSIVKTKKPHVIFSDQRMPVTTGVEFFNAVRQVFPDPIRILITGYTDVNDIIDAINKGHVYRYITKPWSEAEIKVAVENAYDLYQTKKELAQRVNELEKTNHELNRFVYSVSHDLRAPIASVLGLIKVSELEVEDASAVQLFEKMDTSVTKLDILVNNILDYYKNAKADADRSRIEVPDLLDEVLDHLHLSGQLQLSQTHEGDQVLYGDRFRIRVVLSHLLSNAARFKKPDQERAKVSIQSKVDDQEVVLRVRDEGIGMMKEHVDQIFKMFFRGKQDFAGSGLGLYIVKEALDKMEGKIEVVTQLGQGSEFIISLPNRKNEHVHAQAED